MDAHRAKQRRIGKRVDERETHGWREPDGKYGQPLPVEAEEKAAAEVVAALREHIAHADWNVIETDREVPCRPGKRRPPQAGCPATMLHPPGGYSFDKVVQTYHPQAWDERHDLHRELLAVEEKAPSAEWGLRDFAEGWEGDPSWLSKAQATLRLAKHAPCPHLQNVAAVTWLVRPQVSGASITEVTVSTADLDAWRPGEAVPLIAINGGPAVPTSMRDLPIKRHPVWAVILSSL